MRRAGAILALLVLTALGLAVASFAVGETTGTNVACSPAQTIAANGAPVGTIPAVCSTVTYTIPTTTVTVTTQANPCDKYASPAGSDTADGSVGSPYLTFLRLANALTPGQHGCLRAGAYGSTGTTHDVTASGTAGAPITVSSYPGESATVQGWVILDGSYVTLTNIKVDGSNTFFSGGACNVAAASQALDIEGANDTLDHVEYFQSVASTRGNAIGIGFGVGKGNNTTIRYSKVHDVGQCFDYDHLIYLSHGANVQVYNNWLWDDSHGWGVQIYPGATNAHVYRNVIDAAGSGFTICDAVSGNVVDHNVIANSVGITGNGWSVPGAGINGCPPTGTGNSFTTNDVYNNPGGVGSVSNVSITGNVTSNPLFVDAPNHNYAVQAGSPAATWGLWDGG